MKAVMISIHPEWCRKIVDGKKTVELRKSKPKTNLPFKCYIYMTKGFASYAISHSMRCHNNGGMCVIGEFICDSVLHHCEMGNADIAEYTSCVRREDILKYANGKEVFGWHISGLKIYDRPKPLSEFKCLRKSKAWSAPYQMKRPPQSWCYVEELEEDE